MVVKIFDTSEAGGFVITFILSGRKPRRHRDFDRCSHTARNDNISTERMFLLYCIVIFMFLIDFENFSMKIDFENLEIFPAPN